MTRGIRLLTLSIAFVLAAGVACAADNKTQRQIVVASSDMALSAELKNGVWQAVDTTRLFGAGATEAHWVGTLESGVAGKCTAIWYAPDFSVYKSEDLDFKHSAHLVLDLGTNPWYRVPAGEWELCVSYQQEQIIAERFTVRPASPSAALAGLYDILRPGFNSFCERELPELEKKASLDLSLAQYQGGTYVRATGRFKHDFINFEATFTNERLSTVITESTLPICKALFKHFGYDTQLRGFIVELSYEYDDYSTFAKAVRTDETVTFIVPAGTIGKYLDFTLDAQRVVNDAVVAVNGERYNPILQPAAISWPKD